MVRHWCSRTPVNLSLVGRCPWEMLKDLPRLAGVAVAHGPPEEGSKTPCFGWIPQPELAGNGDR